MSEITPFDEGRWPGLTAFREACLAGRHDAMQAIADRGPDWYANENPAGLPMPRLARIFQAQHFAATNQLGELLDLLTRDAAVVNEPWTAQGWLPITQACAHGSVPMFNALLAAGADPCVEVGDPDDRATLVDMARAGGDEELAAWMASVIAARREGGGRKPAELAWGDGWRKEWADDGLSARLVDGDGRVVRTMHCTPRAETAAGVPLMDVRIQDADGRLLATHEPHRLHDTAVDIHVLDAKGRLRGILHHTEMDRDPHPIREAWLDRGW